tara:strand:+ start:330 stop:563 length:234 start_codon:yes stop_codon:yes gene_type:complete
MGYCYDDWRDKKLTIEKDGQFLFNFGESEMQMAENLDSAIINITEGASDEKRSAVNYLEYLVDCLRRGKVEVKWNIS